MKKRLAYLVTTILFAIYLIFTVSALANQSQNEEFLFLPLIERPEGEEVEPASASRQFPVGLSVASPLAAAAAEVDPTGQAGQASPATFRPALQADALEIGAVLTGGLSVSSILTPAGFLLSPYNANCYGPNLDYTDHPDDPGLPDGQLPSGDLGIWLEYESVPVGGQDACAAAQLTKRMFDISNQGKNGLLLTAGMYAVAISNGITLPTSGGLITLTDEMNAASIPNLTFYTATISYDLASDTWAYDTTFVFDNLPRAMTNTVVTRLEHTPNISGTGFSGKLSYLINDMRDAFNCSGGGPGPGPGGPTEVTVNGSLVYSKTSSSEIKLQARTGTFCGYDNDGRADGVVSTSGWTDNYAIFTAEFDPTTTAGHYAYAWQAGHFDAASRVLNTTITESTPLQGEAYFGYGDRVQDDADGSIMAEGLYCNWAGPGPAGGPGSPARFQPYAQRQAVQFNNTTGFYDSTDVDIHYAPTVSCLYDGSGSFWYDRDLDRQPFELSSDIVVTTATLDLLQPYDLDLDSNATITEALEFRGYRLPSVP